MMLAYTVDALVALLRLMFWFLILFVWLPRRLFPAATARSWTRSLFEHVVRMSFATILVVHVLVLVHLYDLFSLLASYVAVHLGYLAWARRLPLRQTARRLWTRLVTFLLDVLETRVQLHRWLRAQVDIIRRDLVASLPHGTDRWWAVAFGTVLGISGYLRLSDVFHHPAPAPWDYYLHLLWLKGLGINRLYVDGVYPYGSHALFEALHRFTALDEALMLRLAPGLVGILVVMTIYWGVVRLTDRRGPALVAAALYGVFAYAGWLPLRLDLQGDVLAVDVALVFLVPTFVFLTEALHLHPFAATSLGPHALWLLLQGMACLFLIHPFVGVLALLGVGGTALATIVLEHQGGTGRQVAYALGAALAGTVLGTLPLLLGLALGKPPHRGLLRWDIHFLGAALREAWFPPAEPAPQPTLLLTLAIAGALVLLLLPAGWGWRGIPSRDQHSPLATRNSPHSFSTFLLILAFLSQPERFGLPELLLPAQVARVLAPVLCVVIGLALYRVWALLSTAAQTFPSFVPRALARGEHQILHMARSLPPRRGWPTSPIGDLKGEHAAFGATALALATMLLIASPLSVPALPRREYDVTTLQLYRIKQEFPTYRWTVVGFPEALPQIYGRGFFVENEVFGARYRPETWRFDPRRPELAIPTPHVFIFVERYPFAAPGMTAEEVAQRDAIAQRLQTWVARYQALHDDMSLYYQDRVLAVYHIYRPPDVEERILEEVERQERERR